MIRLGSRPIYNAKKSYMRDEFDTQSKRPKRIGVIFALAFLVLIVLIGLYVLGASSKKASSPIMPTLKATPTALPVVTKETPVSPTGKQLSPTPKATPTAQSSTLDRSKLEIAVLNGSGVAGAARSTSTFLTGLGYNVTTTGNADAFDYKGLTIHVTKANSAYLNQLKKDLSQKSASISASVDDTIDTDAEVIVGK